MFLGMFNMSLRAPNSRDSGIVRPAPGYRDFGRAGWEGIARGIGNGGYSWSSSFSGTSGVFMDFATQGLHPSNAPDRAHGCQLRCLSE